MKINKAMNLSTKNKITEHVKRGMHFFTTNKLQNLY